MNSKQSNETDFDAVVVGAGFSGMYMLYILREAGYSVKVYEKGEGVGGTWYWNRYPGARCDSASIYYNYTFSEELYKGWSWSSRYPEQPEILRYLNYVADELDLRRDIEFETVIQQARYNEESNQWHVRKDDGSEVTATYFITAVGCLSASNVPDFKGLETFKGDWYHTGRWPHEGVDFTGKRVGVIGTGSSGVQAIPVIAEEAKHLTVFQRTPQYCFPARNHPYKPEFVDEVKNNFYKLKKELRESSTGQINKVRKPSALDDTPEERQKAYEDRWKEGGYLFLYDDLLINEKSNETAAEFIRSKIKETVKDPETAEKLLPTYYWGTKRQILDSNYYETYNMDHVDLVDVKKHPITEITEKGVKTTEEEYDVDVIVFATGYDGMTGPLFKMDIRGRDGVELKEKWENGSTVKTYLGLSTTGFPNMFMITGPESPSVLSNMPISIEQHVEWIFDCIQYLSKHKVDEIEAKTEAENEWSKHCREVADTTLMTKADSWYTGANIKGKARGFPMYIGGVGVYREMCSEIAANGYEGFALSSSRN
ncbi:flavin-containing monooxygenase [Virgibacillus sp. W0181]|uniref:flavin-containing monooxygenase n=1 Tax=Virgibacillus sp. W0181 TaxID=3391581 RepID=UPI003F45DA09